MEACHETLWLCVLQVAYMSRSEMSSFDSCFIGPFLLITNQYLGVIVDEYFMLWFCFVSSFFSANMLQLLHTVMATCT